MSSDVPLGIYGHHNPDFLHGAARAITARERVPVAERWLILKMLGKKGKKAQ